MKTDQHGELEDEKTRKREGGRAFNPRRTGAGSSAGWQVRNGAFSLPEGDLKIARQFTAGCRRDIAQVPKGRLNLPNFMRPFPIPFSSLKFGRPFGTRCSYSSIPPLKGWAILKSPFGRQQPNRLCSSTNGRPNNVKVPARRDPPFGPRRA